VLSLSAAVPGNSDSGCITVSYTGSLASPCGSTAPPPAPASTPTLI
jgi:hypothetical protein